MRYYSKYKVRWMPYDELLNVIDRIDHKQTPKPSCGLHDKLGLNTAIYQANRELIAEKLSNWINDEAKKVSGRKH